MTRNIPSETDFPPPLLKVEKLFEQSSVVTKPLVSSISALFFPLQWKYSFRAEQDIESESLNRAHLQFRFRTTSYLEG